MTPVQPSDDRRQLSMHLLVLSVFAMLAGMFILIWSVADGPKVRIGRGDWWTNEEKLALTFSSMGLLVAALFIWEQIELYTWHGADDTVHVYMFSLRCSVRLTLPMIMQFCWHSCSQHCPFRQNQSIPTRLGRQASCLPWDAVLG